MEKQNKNSYLKRGKGKTVGDIKKKDFYSYYRKHSSAKKKLDKLAYGRFTKDLMSTFSEAIVKDAINTEIIETSTNVDAVVKAKLREFANSLDRQKLETQGNYNDQVKFSKSQVQAALDLKSLILLTNLSSVVISSKSRL